ncbi:MAG: thioredoxin family protein [Aureliella sp.]
MSKPATFYHAGCPVCVSAENAILNAIDQNQYEVEVVHLGDTPQRITEAESAGVRSVPALVIDDQVLHINHGADISALK